MGEEAVFIPDVNLLLYAEIDAFPQHEAARAWSEASLNGETRIGLTSVSLFGFVRIGTSRRVFTKPLSVQSAVSRVQGWLERPQVSFLAPGRGHLESAFELLARLGTGGNLTTGVQLAAFAIENGGEVASNDLDFGSFAGLRWTNPLA